MAEEATAAMAAVTVEDTEDSTEDFSAGRVGVAPEIDTGMTLEQRFDLCRSVGEECIQEEELRNLLDKKPVPVCYDGFEPSGRMHIAQGVFKALNVNKCTAAGGTFIFWVADWFALMNDKMGGDLERIKPVGQYLIQVRTSSMGSAQLGNGTDDTLSALAMRRCGLPRAWT